MYMCMYPSSTSTVFITHIQNSTTKIWGRVEKDLDLVFGNGSIWHHYRTRGIYDVGKNILFHPCPERLGFQKRVLCVTRKKIIKMSQSITIWTSLFSFSIHKPQKLICTLQKFAPINVLLNALLRIKDMRLPSMHVEAF